MKDFKLKVLVLIFTLYQSSIYAKNIVVINEARLNKAIATSKPGDNIILRNGTWKNIELLFEANGTASKPIKLSAQTKGKVIITGNSNLRIAGSHLVVEGLVFKKGFALTSDLISFRKDKTLLANNCRLTECVIDNFNSPERNNVEAWVVLFGNNNEVDHCQFIDKRNQGVTMIVRLDGEGSGENKHFIHHNYFGFRQNLGSNGGETLRIGTSHTSMINSNTLVENNYFDECNGEQEIISNKSNQNTYRKNTFFACQGTLTMRHGNETLVEDNVLLGNNVPYTGGIRVINEKQTVRNNYCEGLAGIRFRGALTIMNGVPNSPLNRYVPVKESEVSNNTFIDCENIELGAGNDAERSQNPESTRMTNNLFYKSDKNQQFGIYADLSGIDFQNNILNGAAKLPSANGFKVKDITLITLPNGLKTSNEAVGATIPKDIAKKNETGVTWYPKAKKSNAGAKILVKPGLNSLHKAVAASKANDTLQLLDGTYHNSKVIMVSHPIVIKGKDNTIITFENINLFQLENEGSLRLNKLLIDGDEAPDSPFVSVVATSKYGMNRNYSLFIDYCSIINMNKNNLFNVLRAYNSTFADSIVISNSTISNLSGTVLELNKEQDNIGLYNVEAVVLDNCTFENIGGEVATMYRGGTDESTIAGSILINHCLFSKVGNNKNNKSGKSLMLQGVQVAEIKNSIFEKSKGIGMKFTVGDPEAKVHHCYFDIKDPFAIEGVGFTQENLSINEENPKMVIGDDGKIIGKQ